MAQHICRTCGKELDNNIKFCPNCGAPQEKETPCICEDCGKEVPVGSEICPNCGRPVKSSKSETTKRMRVERQKAPSTGKVILTVLGLTFLTVLVVAAGLFGISKFHDIRQHKETLAQAEVLMNSGEYTQALQIYESLVDDPATEEHANQCRYRFGKSLMDSGNWDQAKVQLQSISVEDYEDSAALIEQCDSEIARIEEERRQAEEAERKRREDAERKANSADDAFLRDLQSIIIGRLSMGNQIPDKAAIELEYNTLQQYRTKKYYDNTIGTVAHKIITIFWYQKEAITENEILHYRQERFLEENIDLAVQLRKLYDDYGFMKGNDAFRKQYIVDTYAQNRFYSEVTLINDDINKSLDEAGSWTNADDYSAYMLIHNKRNSTISVQFYYEVYSSDESKFLYSDSFSVDNIPPHKDYYIYLKDAFLATYNGTGRVYTDWIVTNIQ